MFFRDTYKIAFRQLRRTGRRTFLTILAVTISIGFMVILVSLGEGLKQVSLRRIATVSELSRITVSSDFGNDKTLNNQTISKIRNISEVRNVYPQVLASGKMEHIDKIGNKTILEGNIIALYPEDFSRRNFTRMIGDGFRDASFPEIIFSSAALKAFPEADAMDFINEKVKLSAEFSEFLFKDIDNPADTEFKIVGIVENDDDSVRFYIPLPIAAKWTKGQYTSAAVDVSDPKKLTEIAQRIEKMGFPTASLSGLVEKINNIFAVTQMILGFFGSVSLIVAAIGLINTMTIALLERTREVGIMKAVGASGWDVSKLFLTESAMIGFWGGAAGIALGMAVGEILNFIGRNIIETLSGESIGRIFAAPWEFLIIIFFSSIALSVISGIYPALQAARLNPAEALRYD